jgi:trimeric autotransporter adhesin
VKPYKWSISSGALPPGLAVSSGGSTTGKPTTAGNLSFVVRVDDSAGGAAGVPRTIYVFRQIAFTTSRATCSGTYLTGCTTQLKYTGGASSAPKVNVTQNLALYPPLPPGSTFTAKAGVVNVSIPPVCTLGNGTAIVTVVLVDQSPCGAGFNCLSGKLSLTINLPGAC